MPVSEVLWSSLVAQVRIIKMLGLSGLAVEKLVGQVFPNKFYHSSNYSKKLFWTKDLGRQELSFPVTIPVRVRL